MPKILLILSVVFMLGSAVLGFLNKSKIDTVASERDAAKNTADVATADSAKNKKSLKDANDKLMAETAKMTELEQMAASKDGELAKAKADVQNFTAQLTDKTAAYDAAIVELEKLKANPTEKLPDVVPVDNPSQVTELNAQIEALRSEKQIIGDKLIAAESKTKELSTEIAKAKGAIMAKGLEGQIIAVNQAWGFVVLNLGDRSGIVNNAEMVVMRDGDRVGKIKITSVEPSNSIADIVSSTVSEGQRVQPGDRVIYAGN